MKWSQTFCIAIKTLAINSVAYVQNRMSLSKTLYAISFRFFVFCFCLLLLEAVANLFITFVHYFTHIIPLVCKQGNLPVALIFDYPENSVKPEDLNALMNQFGVVIAARTKQRQSTLCIVIKGIEKYVGNFLNKINFGIQN